MPKKQVSFRLDERIVSELENIAKEYKKLTMTDIVEVVLKDFISGLYEEDDDEFRKLIADNFLGSLDVRFDTLIDKKKRTKS